MPGVDGLDALRRYRADPIAKDIPVIVLSTKEDPTVKSEAFTAGANDYLVKLPDRDRAGRPHPAALEGRLNQLQRDEAYRALRESQQQLVGDQHGADGAQPQARRRDAAPSRSFWPP